MAAITHHRGKYSCYRFECYDADGATIDPSETATAVSFTVKQFATSTDVAILLELVIGDGVSFTTDGGVTYIDVEVDVAGDDTSAIDLAGAESVDLAYDLQHVSDSGKVRLLAKDTFTLELPVKQAAPA